MTASTRSGSRAPDSKAWSAPSSSARSRLASLRLVAQTRKPAAPAEQDQRGGDAAAGALDEYGRAGLEPGPVEQHAVGGQVGGRQAGGLVEGQRGGLGHQVAPGHRDPLGERAVVALGQQRPARVEGLVAARRRPGRRSRACTTTSRPSSSTPAASQPRIIGSRSAGRPDAAQRPDVVVVERRRLDRDRGPAVGRSGVGVLAELEAGERVVWRPGGRR